MHRATQQAIKKMNAMNADQDYNLTNLEWFRFLVYIFVREFWIRVGQISKKQASKYNIKIRHDVITYNYRAQLNKEGR